MSDKDVDKAQVIVAHNEHGRIITMDSMTYADARNFNCDVLVAASYFGEMPVRFWLLPLSPKGVIAHAAGVGGYLGRAGRGDCCVARPRRHD